jgi:hypothetical protein
MRLRLTYIVAITLAALAVLCTLPLFPLLWLWLVLKGEEP